MAAGENHTVTQIKIGEVTQNRQKIESETGTEMEAGKRSGFEMGRKGEGGMKEGREDKAARDRDRTRRKAATGHKPRDGKDVLQMVSATIPAGIHTSQWFTNYMT